MTANGEFVSPPVAPWTTRILMWTVVIAMIAGALSIAAFALWLALIILPVALGAAAVAYAMFRYRMWRAQRSAAHASVGGQRGVWRP